MITKMISHGGAALPSLLRGTGRVKSWRHGEANLRNAAMASRLALEAPAKDSASYLIAAADTVMDRPSAELLAEVFPGVTLPREVGEFGTLLAIDRARAALGFTAQHSWRDHLAPRSP